MGLLLYKCAGLFLTLMLGTGGVLSASASRLPVFVSILPQKHFVEKIGGDRVDVSVLVQPGANPVTYAPKPRQMAALSGAQVYFTIGVPFETVWGKRIARAHPKLLIIATDEGIEKIPMLDGHGHTGGHGAHGAESPDPHIWLSPDLVKVVAGNILKGLVRVDPAHESIYAANKAVFDREIDRVDAELKTVFRGKRGLEFMSFHPSWGYFAKSYGLIQTPVEIEGKTPKPARLQALITHARNRGIRVIFVQPQFSKKSAQTIADAIGGSIVFADPMALDWADNLRKQAHRLRDALR